MLPPSENPLFTVIPDVLRYVACIEFDHFRRANKGGVAAQSGKSESDEPSLLPTLAVALTTLHKGGERQQVAGGPLSFSSS